MSDSVAIAWCDPGEVSGRFMASVLDITHASTTDLLSGVRDFHQVVGYLHLESGPMIAKARNQLVSTFLEKDSFKDTEWLLMLDADMTFDENLVRDLLANVRNANGKVMYPVMGGLCFGGGHGSIFPTMYRVVEPETNHGNAISIVSEYSDGEMVNVDATGAACLMIHRGVLEHLQRVHEEPLTWFAPGVYKGMEYGEDWTFCMRVRKLGYPITVNTAVKVGHMKSVELNEAMYREGASGLRSVNNASPIAEIREDRRPARALPASRPLKRSARRAAGRQREHDLKAV